jgi:hypothetical protein
MFFESKLDAELEKRLKRAVESNEVISMTELEESVPRVNAIFESEKLDAELKRMLRRAIEGTDVFFYFLE